MKNYDLVAPDESQPVRILSRLVDDALHHRQGTFGRAAKTFVCSQGLKLFGI